MGAEQNNGSGKHEKFAATIVALLEKGAAPWQKPWRAGDLNTPHNPTSGTVYKGINRIMLSVQGYDDPRWLTLKQANDRGWRVTAGARSTLIEHWQWTRKEQSRDEDGNLKFDDEGKPIMVEVKLARPRVRYFNVFHSSQVQTLDGQAIPRFEPMKVTWDPNERAEAILEHSGAGIYHDQADRAYYIMSKDEIHLPPKANFDEASLYYATALHELGHWTRHPSRLNRENGPYGSPDYAREELRAEIASWMLAQDLGLSFDPSHHVAYVADWIKALKEDPHEIVRAAKDAERIKQYLMNMELGLDQGEPFIFTDLPAGSTLGESQPEPVSVAPPAQAAALASPVPASEIVWLSVSYAEKNQAKAAGARWDREAKSWYAPAGTDLGPLARWRPERVRERTLNNVVVSPEEEFRQVLVAAGFSQDGEPVLDGRIHRVPILGAAYGTKDGAYCGFRDGQPNGWFKNHKTGLQGKWLYSAQVLTQIQKFTFQAEALERQAMREQELKNQQEEAAQRAFLKLGRFARRLPDPQHPYLQAKGVNGQGLNQDDHGNLLVPGINLDQSHFSGPNGKILLHLQTLQSISPDGKKHFEPGSKKTGAVCLITAGLFEQLAVGQSQAEAAEAPEILVAEGYATGATLHQATGLPVAVAFDAGNLGPAAEALKRRFPQATITFCADNDHHLEENVGLIKAQKAAQAVGGRVLVPDFSGEEKRKKLTDWNDLAKSRGLAAVTQAIQRNDHRRKEAPAASTNSPALF
jgi:antirestriction protein ArdC/phage/plasmid primase-like uncharacterized protein